jgi:hypothetical protein
MSFVRRSEQNREGTYPFRLDSRQMGSCPIFAYSIFTSSAYRTGTAKWRFPQEIATLCYLAMSTSEVKML